MAAGRGCPGAAGGGVGWLQGRFGVRALARVRVTPLPERAGARGHRRKNLATETNYSPNWPRVGLVKVSSYFLHVC